MLCEAHEAAKTAKFNISQKGLPKCYIPPDVAYFCIRSGDGVRDGVRAGAYNCLFEAV